MVKMWLSRRQMTYGFVVFREREAGLHLFQALWIYCLLGFLTIVLIIFLDFFFFIAQEKSVRETSSIVNENYLTQWSNSFFFYLNKKGTCQHSSMKNELSWTVGGDLPWPRKWKALVILWEGKWGRKWASILRFVLFILRAKRTRFLF